MRAPDAPRQAYNTVLVVFPVSDLGARSATETAFLPKHTKATWSQWGPSATASRFVRSTDLFFPGREYTVAESQEILQKNNIQAVLILSLHSAGTEVVGTTPTATSMFCTSQVGTNCTNIGAISSGGAPLSAEWATFRARLVDVESGKVVWIASMNSNGTPLSDSADLLVSMAKSTKEQLETDGLAQK